MLTHAVTRSLSHLVEVGNITSTNRPTFSLGGDVFSPQYFKGFQHRKFHDSKALGCKMSLGVSVVFSVIVLFLLLNGNTCITYKQVLFFFQKRCVQVYLPEAYELESSPIPVLYFLSGLTCTDENASQKSGIQRYADEYGIAVVFPDTSPRGHKVVGESDSWDFGVGAGKLGRTLTL